MKVWISCLLLGSISCSPPQGDGSHSPGQNHMPLFFLSPLSFGSEPSGQSAVSDHPNHQGLPQSNNMGGARDAGFWAQKYIPEFFQFWYPELDEAASADSSSPHQSAEESWSHASDQEEEPFFTDMTGHDPLFTLDSHTNYLRKRNVVTKASFTPRRSHPKRLWSSGGPSRTLQGLARRRF